MVVYMVYQHAVEVIAVEIEALHKTIRNHIRFARLSLDKRSLSCSHIHTYIHSNINEAIRFYLVTISMYESLYV